MPTLAGGSPRIVTHHVPADGLAADGALRIAVLSDFHAHPRCINRADMSIVVERTNGLSPDLIVLLGDYCSQEPGPLGPRCVAAALRGLSAPLGVFAVQGNHDWHDDGDAMARGHGPTRTEEAFAEAGIRMLENEAVRLPGGSAWLAGIESEYVPGARDARRRGRDGLSAHRAAALRKALADVPDGSRAILLAHEPDIFADGMDPRVGLVLSGHTHGGQVRLLGWSPVIPSRYGNRFAHGLVRGDGRHMVVSGGLGSHFVAGRPLRVGMPPEITVVEVKGPQGRRSVDDGGPRPLYGAGALVQTAQT